MKNSPFLRSYIATALWSSNDESTPSGGEPMDTNYSSDDLAPETVQTMRADCADFLFQARRQLRDDNCTRDTGSSVLEQAAHDFWLTRNGHGAGFWDGDWAELAASILDQISRKAGEVDLYIADDGLVYQS